MRRLRMLLGCLVGIAAFLTGCNSGSGNVPLYGILPPADDPSVDIADFSYTPGSPVTLGSSVDFHVTINKHTDALYAGNGINVSIGSSTRPVPGSTDGVATFGLTDSGMDGDEVAGDLIYSRRVKLSAEYFGTAEGLPVIAKIDWFDGTPDKLAAADPLTIIEEETP